MTKQETDGGGFPGEKLALGLGWVGIGLGVAQLVAPGRVARMIGVPLDARTRSTMVAVGLREITVGLGLLLRPRPGFAWLRVAGDLMDLAFLGKSLASADSHRPRVIAAAAGVVGIGVLDTVAARAMRSTTNGTGLAAGRAPQLGRAVTIQATPAEVYAAWRKLENLAQFMAYVDAVEVIDERRSHWVIQPPLGPKIEWDAEITEDRPGEQISWRSVAGARIELEGTVRFTAAPGRRGTEVGVQMRFSSPLGRADRLLALLLGEYVRADLRRFKQFIEIGEVMKSDASIHRGLHPARPSGRVGDAEDEPRKRRARRGGERPRPMAHKEVER